MSFREMMMHFEFIPALVEGKMTTKIYIPENENEGIGLEILGDKNSVYVDLTEYEAEMIVKQLNIAIESAKKFKKEAGRSIV